MIGLSFWKTRTRKHTDKTKSYTRLSQFVPTISKRLNWLTPFCMLMLILAGFNICPQGWTWDIHFGHQRTLRWSLCNFKLANYSWICCCIRYSCGQRRGSWSVDVVVRSVKPEVLEDIFVEDPLLKIKFYKFLAVLLSSRKAQLQANLCNTSLPGRKPRRRKQSTATACQSMVWPWHHGFELWHHEPLLSLLEKRLEVSENFRYC